MLELSNHEQRLKSLPSLVTQAGSCKTYGMVVEHLCARNTLLPPQDAVLEGRMTVALDLDNTLVSSTSILLHRRSQCDFEVRDNGSRKCIKKRPHLDEFLDALALFAEEALFKDLAILGRDLRKVVLVDDDPGFFCQPGSGNEIVIGKFTGQRSDDELLKPLPVLQSLAQLDDVRPAVASSTSCERSRPEETWRMAIEDKYSRKLFSSTWGFLFDPFDAEGNKPGSGYIQTLAARDIMTIVACEGLVDTYHIWDARVKRAGFEGVAVTEEIYEKQVKFSQMDMTISSQAVPGFARGDALHISMKSSCDWSINPSFIVSSNDSSLARKLLQALSKRWIKNGELMSACTTDWNNITGLKLRIFSKKSFRGCR
ncbi:hypothetical protein SELMODRAFT_421682 [Selaginella moellendorffii]|uniref:Mitochondrial import inner membrane translocase subunit TIM50 n=1 Tax=Selaginella moellendorffii TaxID=88036 RepID=D8SG14_SELML|nr:hypothetical protein SELMODRAFT_421682 [Selaginella moellendorffii]